MPLIHNFVVYTMWQYPNMLPKLYTWGPVVQKLIDGAGILWKFETKKYHEQIITLN